jgi:hypothetical protein
MWSVRFGLIDRLRSAVVSGYELAAVCVIADNLASRIISITRTTDDVVDALRLQRLFTGVGGVTGRARSPTLSASAACVV